MTRITITKDDEYTGGRTVEGWFETRTVTERIEEEQDWDGNNNRGRMSGLQCGYERLLRTAGGRWVRHYNSRNEFNGPEYYEFLNGRQAWEWLIRNGNVDILEKYFGKLEAERAPGGRPAIEGDAVNFKPGAELLKQVDAYATGHEMTRAAALRALIAAGLAREGAAATLPG